MGISIAPEHIENFVEIFEAVQEGDEEERGYLGEIGRDVLRGEIFGLLDSFAPYGEGNPEPIFSIKELEVLECKKIGKDKEHTSLRCKVFGRMLKAGAFFQEIDDVKMLYDVYFYLKKDLYTQQPTLHIQSFLCPSSPKIS